MNPISAQTSPINHALQMFQSEENFEIKRDEVDFKIRRRPRKK